MDDQDRTPRDGPACSHQAWHRRRDAQARPGPGPLALRRARPGHHCSRTAIDVIAARIGQEGHSGVLFADRLRPRWRGQDRVRPLGSGGPHAGARLRSCPATRDIVRPLKTPGSEGRVVQGRGFARRTKRSGGGLTAVGGRDHNLLRSQRSSACLLPPTKRDVARGAMNRDPVIRPPQVNPLARSCPGFSRGGRADRDASGDGPPEVRTIRPRPRGMASRIERDCPTACADGVPAAGPSSLGNDSAFAPGRPNVSSWIAGAHSIPRRLATRQSSVLGEHIP